MRRFLMIIVLPLAWLAGGCGRGPQLDPDNPEGKISPEQYEAMTDEDKTDPYVLQHLDLPIEDATDHGR